MKKLLLTLGLVGTLLLPVFAKEYKIPKENPIFSIVFPDKWEVTYEDESVDALSPDNAIEVYIQTDDAETIEDSVKETIDYLVTEGVKLKPDTQKDSKVEINGMEVTGLQWEGTDEDGPCNVSLDFIAISEKEVITLLYWGTAEQEQKHAKDIEAIVKSMKSLKKGKKGKAAKAEDADSGKEEKAGKEQK